MAASDLVNLSGLMDDAKCFALVRQHRWPEGVRCPACASSAVIRDGCDDRQRPRQRYRCKACSGRFDDLTGTVPAGHRRMRCGMTQLAWRLLQFQPDSELAQWYRRRVARAGGVGRKTFTAAWLGKP